MSLKRRKRKSCSIWQHSLPMQIHLDFETRSGEELRKSGVHRYSQDPSTDLWCVCFCTPDSPDPQVWLPGDMVPDEITEVVRDGTLHAWNASFERIIWKYILSPRYEWPSPDLRQWRCTMAEGRAFGLPGKLKDAALALGVEQTKDVVGERIMQRMAKPRRWEGSEPIWWNDAKKLNRLIDYCKQDVRTEMALSKAIPRLSEDELRTYHFDQIINDRGLDVDMELVKASQVMIAAADQQINTRLKSITGVNGSNSVNQLRSWIEGRGVKCPSISKGAVASMLKQQIPDDVREALELRVEGAKTSCAKLKKVQSAVCIDGKLRGMFLFHGAGTGRWAGRLVQLHNLPRGLPRIDIPSAIEDVLGGDLQRVEAHGPLKEVISTLLRSVLIAPEAKELVTVDFASIEARILAWLAKEESFLSAFKEGVDVYKVMASRIYGGVASAVTKMERHLGKQAILGCGYGMGHKRFRKQCADNGIEISKAMAEMVVKTYRESNTGISRFWKGLEAAAKRTVSSHRANTVGLITTSMKDGVLRIKLPSARYLHYQQPKLVRMKTSWGEVKPQLTYMAISSTSHKWERTTTYGGKLTENVVQAVARDLLRDAMFRLQRNGFRVLGHVHDEVIAVPTFEMPMPLERMEAVMKQVPAWANGLPVDAEGWTGKRYRK